MLLSGARVVTPHGVIDPGWILIEQGRIATLGAGDPPQTTDEHLNGRWLLPGMIDIHVHGGGGASLMVEDPNEVARAVAFHRAHGTTRLLASLATAPVQQLERTIAALASAADLLAGIHLEGPFLAPARCGAQDPRFMLAPDRETLARLLDAGGGAVKMVTLAPELPQALDLIEDLVTSNVIAAIGHTDATYEQTMNAIDAGATVATHLFNGMRPLHHRDPGAALACLQRQEVTCELIADGVHLHPRLIAHVIATKPPGRVALITDAMAAAGMGDGAYKLGSANVEVRHGVARLGNSSTLAGSTLTMAAALRKTAEIAGPSVAVDAAATTPARLLGLTGQAGAIVAGAAADLVLCDQDFALQRVMIAGAWVAA
jgi:N-acetylglucosamine-6-phosphate deacetylase